MLKRCFLNALIAVACLVAQYFSPVSFLNVILQGSTSLIMMLLFSFHEEKKHHLYVTFCISLNCRNISPDENM